MEFKRPVYSSIGYRINGRTMQSRYINTSMKPIIPLNRMLPAPKTQTNLKIFYLGLPDRNQARNILHKCRIPTGNPQHIINIFISYGVS